jgi:hypothetical protein
MEIAARMRPVAPAGPRHDDDRRSNDNRWSNDHTAAHWPTASNTIRSAPPPGTTAVADLLQQSGTALLNGGGQSGLTHAGRSYRRRAQHHSRSHHQSRNELSHSLISFGFAIHRDLCASIALGMPAEFDAH